MIPARKNDHPRPGKTRSSNRARRVFAVFIHGPAGIGVDGQWRNARLAQDGLLSGL